MGTNKNFSFAKHDWKGYQFTARSVSVFFSGERDQPRSVWGMTRFSASDDMPGASHRNKNVAAAAPANCARAKYGTSIGRIPENVSVNERAIATAGFANEVGRREPIRGNNVGSDSEWNCAGAESRAAPDDAQQSESCHEFAEDLRRAAANMT